MLRQILFIKLTTKREQKQNGGRKNLAKKCFWRHNNFVNQLTSKILLTVDSREKKERRKRGQLFLSPSYAIFFFPPKSSVFIFLFSNFHSFLKWSKACSTISHLLLLFSNYPSNNVNRHLTCLPFLYEESGWWVGGNTGKVKGSNPGSTKSFLDENILFSHCSIWKKKV